MVADSKDIGKGQWIEQKSVDERKAVTPPPSLVPSKEVGGERADDDVIRPIPTRSISWDPSC